MQIQELQLPSEVSDEALAQQAFAGNEEAFELLTRRYHSALFNVIYRYVQNYHDACDIMQQVLIQLYLSLASFNAGKPIRAWLFRVARNRCIDHARRKHMVSFSELEGVYEDDALFVLMAIADTEPLPEEVAEYHETRQRLDRAIRDLPPRYSRVVFLHSIAQLSFAEIGLALNMPVATAKTYFYRARVLLRGKLEAQII